VVTTGEELVAALRTLPQVRADHAEQYSAFRAKYCSLEDGRATDRLLDHLGL
jgi:CDP-glycerol glycerophosphotransferase